MNVKFPTKPTSSKCKHLIKDLLIKDEYKRLGSKNGAADIKSHSYFHDVKWALLRNTEPPMIPKISDRLDTGNFRNIKDDEGEMVEFEEEVLYSELDDNNPFNGFETLSVVRD